MNRNAMGVDVIFGGVDTLQPNWRNDADDNDDDEPSSVSPRILREMLGFDPGELDEPNSDEVSRHSRSSFPDDVTQIASRFGLSLRMGRLPGQKVSSIDRDKNTLWFDMAKATEAARQASKGGYSTDLLHHAILHDIGLFGMKKSEYQGLWDKVKHIAMRVSVYAAKGVDEFIGECFAGMAAGKTYDQEVVQLFDECCGYAMPPG